MSNEICVLVVDDAQYTRDMTLAMLRSISMHNIIEAENGSSALEIIKSKDIDIILLDVVMPGLSGIEVLRQLRADNSTSAKKVILVTAAADAKTVLLARSPATRADAEIVKPFSITTLREKIKHVMKAS